MNNTQREYEIAFIIVDENPEDLFELILNQIQESFPIQRYAEVGILEDTYLDTHNLLKKHGIALRLRRKGSQQKVALKGRLQPGPVPWRAEWENLWSPDTCRELVGKLRHLGIDHYECRFLEDGKQWFLDCGFSIIQARKTLRRVAHITNSSHSELLGEISLDEVQYQYKGELMTIYELEIEAAGERNVSFIPLIHGIFSPELNEKLYRTNFSKLELGFVIEKLLDQRIFESTDTRREWTAKLILHLGSDPIESL